MQCNCASEQASERAIEANQVRGDLVCFGWAIEKKRCSDWERAMMLIEAAQMRGFGAPRSPEIRAAQWSSKCYFVVANSNALS